MWERGLKHLFLSAQLTEFAVAPHVGAWIETSELRRGMVREEVAPHVGAWIETSTR